MLDTGKKRIVPENCFRWISKTYEMSALLPVDRWILERVNETTARVAELLEEYGIGQARHEIDTLFWKDFCDYYIEIAKERLYQPEKHGREQRYSGQIAVYYSLFGILKLYAIYAPYITEAVYQDFYRKYERESSLHQTLWERKKGACTGAERSIFRN